MDSKLHPWFVSGVAMALGALIGRHIPHPWFVCLVVGCLAITLLGILKTLKRWDG